MCLYLCPCSILSQGLIQPFTNFICKMLAGMNVTETQLKSQHENSNKCMGSSLTGEGYRKCFIPFTFSLQFDLTEAMWDKEEVVLSLTDKQNTPLKRQNQRCLILP